MKRHNLKNVSFSRIALVDKGASQDPKDGSGAHVLIFKRATADGDTTMNLEAILKALATLKPEEKESLQKALGAAPAPEDILKGASPEVRALIEKAQADAKKAAEEAAANKAAIEKLQKDARNVDLRKRADAFTKMSGDKGVLAEVIGLVEDHGDDAVKKSFGEMLKGWNEQLSKGGILKDPAGSRGTFETASGETAYESAKKLADAIVQKNAAVTPEAALMQVFAAHPELYERHRAESAHAGSRDKN